MTVEEFSCTNDRNEKLFGIAVLPTNLDIKCGLVYQHGYAEHAARKQPAFEQLAAAGCAVYALDAASFGRSEPLEPDKRAMVHHYQHMVDDLCGFSAVARERHQSQGLPEVPWFLGGFSLGGLTAAHAALREQQQWAGLVLVSGCMGVVMSVKTQLQRVIGPMLNAVMPNAQIVEKIDPMKLNPDPGHAADYEADELVYRQPTRVSTAWQMGLMVNAMKVVRPQLQLPIYAVHATNDLITPYKDLVEFLEGVSSTDKQLRTIEGGYHDLISGKDTSTHVADIAHWLLQRV